MRLRSVLGWTAATLVICLAGALPSSAQPANPPGGYILVDPRTGAVIQRPRQADPNYGRPQPGYYQPAPPPQRRGPNGYYPGMLVQPAPQPQPGFNLRRLFGMEEPQPAPVPREAPRIKPVRPKPPPVAVARQVKPKVNPSTHVVVFGDALAEMTAQGLEDVFADTPDVAVAEKVRGEGGLMGSEAADWPKIVQDAFNGGQKITLAAVMLGANDRQAIKEGETVHEPLSSRWRDVYRDRIAAVARVFRDRGVPFVWIGLPPMKNDRLSADLIAMNEIVRDTVQRNGGSYVDIWPGFVNDENRYTATGPDVDGQTSRLRANDGVLFTKAGARKVAHFADTEIRRILEARQAGTALATLPAAGAPVEGPSTDQLINAALPAPPEPPGLPTLAAKPVAGPVLPLTRPEVSPGGTLASGRPRLDGDAAYNVQKALREGVAPSPRPGRADDFRWPRS